MISPSAKQIVLQDLFPVYAAYGMYIILSSERINRVINIYNSTYTSHMNPVCRFIDLTEDYRADRSSG